MKHTPGPWHITFYVFQEDRAAPTGRRAQIMSDTPQIGGIMDGAYIAADNAGVAEVRRHGKAAVADARLIAAAPDMLAALRVILPRLEDMAQGCEDDEPDALAVKMARGAIEKAEGR